MKPPRALTSVISILLMIAVGFALLSGYIIWSRTLVYLLYVLLAVYFLGILVSNQQFDEDILAKFERISAAFLLSYVVFIQMIYAPLARYFFQSLIQQKFFLSDVLALLLFLFFIFLFGTSMLILNSFSRFSFLSNWTLFNSAKSYSILRSLWPASILFTVYLFLLMPFIIITV
jgi:hypothetical protein